MHLRKDQNKKAIFSDTQLYNFKQLTPGSVGQYSVVGIVARYGLDGPGIEAR